MQINNITYFLMLMTITGLLLSGCSSTTDKKITNIPFSIIKKLIIGLD